MTLALFQHCPIRTPVRRPGALSRSFFFSSRRRHTRCLSGWSSDVCSSDLVDSPAEKAPERDVADGLADHRLPDGALDELLPLGGRTLFGLEPEIPVPRDRRAVGADVGEVRSEERRGGKGGRSGRAANDEWY